MTASISTKRVSGTNAILARSYPAIEEGNDAFPDGDYRVQTGSNGSDNTGFVLKHSVVGAQLISQMIANKHAQYVCSLAAPRSAYREIQCSLNPTQEIAWDNAKFGEPPYFTPMIVCMRELSCTLNSEKDGVHSDWDGLKIVFPKGARIAQGPVLNLRASNLHGIISIVPDENLRRGQFHTEAVDSDAFRFVVRCDPGLHTLLQDKGHQQDKRADVMTHIVTSCLSALQWKYKDLDGDGEEGWRSYKVLESLANELESMGYTNWEDPDFRPEMAATLLYPHELPLPFNSDDE